MFLLFLETWWGNRNKALGDENILLLTGLTGLNLFHHLSASDAFLSTSLELAHVVSITLNLLLLRVDTACIQGGRGRLNTKKGRSGGESLAPKKEAIDSVSASVSPTCSDKYIIANLGGNVSLVSNSLASPQDKTAGS